MLSTMLSRSSCVPLLRVHTSTLTPLQTMATMKPISQPEHLTGQEFWSKNKALKKVGSVWHAHRGTLPPVQDCRQLLSLGLV